MSLLTTKVEVQEMNTFEHFDEFYSPSPVSVPQQCGGGMLPPPHLHQMHQQHHQHQMPDGSVVSTPTNTTPTEELIYVQGGDPGYYHMESPYSVGNASSTGFEPYDIQQQPQHHITSPPPPGGHDETQLLMNCQPLSIEPYSNNNNNNNSSMVDYNSHSGLTVTGSSPGDCPSSGDYQQQQPHHHHDQIGAQNALSVGKELKDFDRKLSQQLDNLSFNFRFKSSS